MAKTKAFAVTLAAALLLLGCGRAEEEQASIKDNYVEGAISTETSSLGIDSNRKDFEELLEDSSFYVVHEGYYYPLYFSSGNEAAENDFTGYMDETRQVYFTLEDFRDIPTLFPGDHLVFYSGSEMLDVLDWERYYDMGFTFGVHELKETAGGHYYLDLSDDDYTPIVPNSELYAIAQLGVSKVTIDRVGSVAVDSSVVSDGVIVGTTRGSVYDMEVYTGTYYKHYSACSNTDAMKSFELFRSARVEALQDKFWEVEVPEYFCTGYYRLNNGGLLRVCREDSYSERTDYNARLIYPNVDELSGKEGRVVVYSEVESLNDFEQDQFPEALGYVDPDGSDAEDAEEAVALPEAAQFKEANVMHYDLWLPAGKKCSVKITSPSEESTGSATLVTEDGASYPIELNRFDKCYFCELEGAGQKASLDIGGFWYDYTIELTNAEIYSGQDAEAEVPSAEAQEGGE